MECPVTFVYWPLFIHLNCSRKFSGKTELLSNVWKQTLFIRLKSLKGINLLKVTVKAADNISVYDVKWDVWVLLAPFQPLPTLTITSHHHLRVGLITVDSATRRITNIHLEIIWVVDFLFAQKKICKRFQQRLNQFVNRYKTPNNRTLH